MTYCVLCAQPGLPTRAICDDCLENTDEQDRHPEYCTHCGAGGLAVGPVLHTVRYPDLSIIVMMYYRCHECDMGIEWNTGTVEERSRQEYAKQCDCEQCARPNQFLSFASN